MSPILREPLSLLQFGISFIDHLNYNSTDFQASVCIAVLNRLNSSSTYYCQNNFCCLKSSIDSISFWIKSTLFSMANRTFVIWLLLNILMCHSSDISSLHFHKGAILSTCIFTHAVSSYLESYLTLWRLPILLLKPGLGIMASGKQSLMSPRFLGQVQSRLPHLVLIYTTFLQHTTINNPFACYTNHIYTL